MLQTRSHNVAKIYNMDWIMPVPSSSMEEKWGSKKLHRLVEQLKLHKWPRMDEENNEKIGANCGIGNYVTNKNKEFGYVNWRERRAAVLICLFEGSQGELRVILTKRSMNLASHPGDVALPGGKMEETDEDDTATALREAMEEIGLDPSLVHVVSNLEPFISQHQLKVIPVIGVMDRIQDFKPLINTSEVDAVFHVPLDMFLKEENHRFEEREWMGLKYVLHLFDFESSDQKGTMMIIWGLTASILIRAASAIYQRSPCFQASLPDFQQLQRALSPPT